MVGNGIKETTMDITAIKLVYFSPTGTTKSVLEGIAQGIQADNVEHLNLTSYSATSVPQWRLP